MGPEDSTMEQILKDEIFDGRDYNVWKARLCNLFKRKKLACVLNRSPEEEPYFVENPDESAEEKAARCALVKNRENQEEEAVEMIHRRLDNEQFKKVIGILTVKGIIEKFDMFYKRSGPQVRAHLRDQMQGLKTRKFRDLKELFDSFDNIIREMEAANYILPKIEKIHYFLESIPGEFSQLVSHYEFLDDNTFQNLSFSEMKSKFFNAELKMKSQVHDELSGASSFMAKRHERKRFKCYTCGEYGHKSFQCTKKSRYHDDESKASKRQKFYAERPERSYVANERFNCILDSGATSHMAKDSEDLTNLTDLPGPVEITLAKEGAKAMAYKKGNLALVCPLGSVQVTIEFCDVLVVPMLTMNLISLQKIESNGHKVIFEAGQVIIKNKNDEIWMTGQKKDALYFLNLFKKYPSNMACLGNISKNMMIWHQKLGHLSGTNLIKLKKNSMADNFNLVVSEKDDYICESCIYGKHNKRKFVSQDIPRSRRPLEIIHTDVCGPFSTKTYDGKSYFLTFIDDYTHFVCVYLLKYKSEVTDFFLIFQNMVTSHFGSKISRLRCDNGGEYL